MRGLSQCVSFVCASLVGAVAAGCGGGDSSAPQTAASVTGVAGDNQTGPTGADLAVPLSLVLLDSKGSPFKGGTVTWSVTGGAATLNPTTSTSDVNGYAATSVTLGPTVGQTTVRASTGTATPVDFHATVVDPCDYAPAHPLGTTVNGRITALDCNLESQGYYYDFYELAAPAQLAVTINMAAVFDTWLDLFDVNGGQFFTVAFNNDVGPSNTNSRINAFIGTGTYLIGANTNFQGTTGAYTLSSAARALTLTGCEIVWATGGISLSGDLSATDCAPSVIPSADTYSDVLEIVAFVNDVLTLTETSNAFTPKVSLYRVDAGVLTPVGSSSAAPTATITYTVQTSANAKGAVFVAFIGAAVNGQTGAYTFTTAHTLAASGPLGTPRVFRLWAPPAGLPRSQ